MTKNVKTLDTILHGSLQSMICQQVTLSGDAEWPKVADAVIEAVPADSMPVQDLSFCPRSRQRCCSHRSLRRGLAWGVHTRCLATGCCTCGDALAQLQLFCR